MSDYDISFLGKRAEELGFIRDTLEKVIRLSDILEHFNKNPLLKESLALKGGTAINLTICNLPRLSVDIDLDYLKTDSREDMLRSRDMITSMIDRYMKSQSYVASPKSKSPLSLDSWVYEYTNAGGNKDNIKLEVNYSLRAHVLPTEERAIISEYFSSDFKVKCLAPSEIYGSKINALLSRAAARDLYDVRKMIQLGLFDGYGRELLKKCVIFYAAVSSKDIQKSFHTKAIRTITQRKIKTDLLPVLKRRDDFNLDEAKIVVEEYIHDLMNLTNEEKKFLVRFENKDYVPELLFDDPEILSRIRNHPMALWKIRQGNGSSI